MATEWQKKWFSIFGIEWPQSPAAHLSTSRLIGKLRQFVDGSDPYAESRIDVVDGTVSNNGATAYRAFMGNPHDERDIEILKMFYAGDIPSKQQVREAVVLELDRITNGDENEQ